MASTDVVLSFRTALRADASPITRLVNSAYRGESSKQGWTTEADLLGGQRTDDEKVLEMIEAPASRIELAFGGVLLVGCVYLRREPAGTCYLGMLTVDPSRQAGGLGKHVLSHAEDTARRWDCWRIRMTVIQQRSELLRFYERRGYALTGASEAFPEDDPRFGLPKVPGLRFLELAKDLTALPHT